MIPKIDGAFVNHPGWLWCGVSVATVTPERHVGTGTTHRKEQRSDRRPEWFRSRQQARHQEHACKQWNREKPAGHEIAADRDDVPEIENDASRENTRRDGPLDGSDNGGYRDRGQRNRIAIQ